MEIGLGKMGFNMAKHLRLGGHKVAGFDFNKKVTAHLTETRLRSREENNFTECMISIQRNAFGGHAVKKA